MESACHLLIIEDNDDEALLIERAARRARQAISMSRCENLTEAKSYLTGAGKYSDRSTYPFPRLVITDLRLGLDNGFDFLVWIRAHATLRVLPVILMSGSHVPDAVTRAYSLGASAVLTKPTEFSEMSRHLDVMAEFWCTIAETPNLPSP